MNGLVTAKELAAYLAVDVAFVYEHADELRARRLGTGPKARLRFSIPDVDAALMSPCSEGRKSEPEPRSTSCKLSTPTNLCPSGAPLLPIRRNRTERAA